MTAGGRRSAFRAAAPLVGLALSLAVLAWVLGFVAALRARQPSPAVPTGVEAPPNWRLFGEAWSLVEREFYWPAPTDGDVTKGAVAGLLKTMDDPYAALLAPGSPEASAGPDPVLVPGAGAWIESVNDGALVLATVPGSPAEKAELVPGDTVVAAGEQILAGMDAGDLVTELAGKTGVTTTVVVRDEDGAGRQVVWMPRAVAAPTVEVSPMGTDALYVRIPVVTAAIDAELAEALSAQGVRAPRSLIVDLRDNPGGDQDALARIAGRLTDGTVWLSVARDGTRQAHKAADSGSPSLDASRVYVLVNEGTADEAEMLAGALRDNNGALLIGKSTFGKGTVQGTEPLADGSLVRLTVARWQTPAGTEPDDVGLKPDKVVPGRDAQLRTARDAALEVSGG